jgi:hypothetical protein
MIVQRLNCYFPCKLRQRVLVIHPDRQVSTIVVPSELRCRDVLLFEGTRFWHWLLELRFFLDCAGDPAAEPLRLGVFGEGAGEGEFVNGLVGGVLEFLLREVLFREVAEGGVRVFGGVLVFPWFVCLVVLLS